MQDNAAAPRRKMLFHEIENRFCRANAVHAQDFVSSPRACLKDVNENLLLKVEGFVKLRAGIQPDFADVASIWKVLIPKRYLVKSLTDELGMEAQSGSNMAGATRQLIVSWPRLGSGGNGECINAGGIRLSDRGFHVREEIEMTMKIDERKCHLITRVLF